MICLTTFVIPKFCTFCSISSGFSILNFPVGNALLRLVRWTMTSIRCHVACIHNPRFFKTFVAQPMFHLISVRSTIVVSFLILFTNWIFVTVHLNIYLWYDFHKFSVLSNNYELDINFHHLLCISSLNTILHFDCQYSNRLCQDCIYCNIKYKHT